MMKTTHTTEEQLDFRKKHLVCDAMYWSYLQGELDPAEALFVSTHYHLSEEARKRVKELNNCAAVSLETDKPVAMTCSAEEFLKKCCAAVAPKKEECASNEASLPVPKPLQRHMGECFDGVKWQTVSPGVHEKRLKLCDCKSTAKVMKIENGVQIPEHTHKGNEMTVILHGSLLDNDETYQPGEVSYHPAHAEKTHAPRALSDCICLVVSENKFSLTDVLSKIMKPFLRLRGV